MYFFFTCGKAQNGTVKAGTKRPYLFNGERKELPDRLMKWTTWKVNLCFEQNINKRGRRIMSAKKKHPWRRGMRYKCAYVWYGAFICTIDMLYVAGFVCGLQSGLPARKEFVDGCWCYCDAKPWHPLVHLGLWARHSAWWSLGEKNNFSRKWKFQGPVRP